MAKYRKKSVVIRAFQMTEESWYDNSKWPEWLNRAWQQETGEEGSLWVDPNAPNTLLCGTLEGPRKVVLNDWIICGIEGEIYPCKPAIFEATYEPAEIMAKINAAEQAAVEPTATAVKPTATAVDDVLHEKGTAE